MWRCFTLLTLAVPLALGWGRRRTRGQPTLNIARRETPKWSEKSGRESTSWPLNTLNTCNNSKSETLGGARDDAHQFGTGSNRFTGTWLGEMPVPLPENYVMGIDLQKWDFERKMWSYLRGEWRLGGWWYYYLYALAIKVPLGTWVLVLLALLLGLFRRGYTASWRDELVLLAPIAVVLTLVSSQTGFNHHLRYVLPIFPFAFIWTSKVARAVELRHGKIATVAAAALLWSVESSLWYYPHSLSYFNELVGGPKHGHEHLLDSNIDWGQDLLYSTLAIWSLLGALGITVGWWRRRRRAP
jgi:hypothetical protein